MDMKPGDVDNFITLFTIFIGLFIFVNSELIAKINNLWQIALSLAAFLFGFYKFGLEKTLNDRIEKIKIVSKRGKEKSINSLTDFIFKEIKKKNPDFKSLESNTSKLSEEVLELKNVFVRYNIYWKVGLGIIFLVFSMLFSLLHSGDPNLWIFSIGNSVISFNLIGMIFFTGGISVTLHIIIVWTEIMIGKK